MRAKYKHVFIGEGQWRDEHIVIAESAIGRRLPPGAEVHHVDGDKFNNSNTNLVVCPSRGYHMLLHRRERALLACGNAGWLKCRYCKQYDAPERLFVSKTLSTGGHNIHHRKCDAEYAKQRRLGN